MNSVLTLLIVCSQLLIIHSYWMFDEDQKSNNLFLQTRNNLPPLPDDYFFSNETHRFRLCPRNIKCLETVTKQGGYEFNITCEGCYNSYNKRLDFPKDNITETGTVMRKTWYNCYHQNVKKIIGCKCPFNR
jgi:hypothetical protein